MNIPSGSLGLNPNMQRSLIQSMASAQKGAMEGVKALEDGHDINYKPLTKVDIVRYDSLLENIARNIKASEVATDAGREMAADAQTLRNIQEKVEELAGYGTNFTPQNPEQVQIARVLAQNVLSIIANSLDPTKVNRASINGVSNLMPGGTASDAYVTLADQGEFVQLENGTKLANPIVAERFKDIIGAMHGILRDTAAPGAVGTPFGADVTSLYASGTNALSDMIQTAKLNQESAEAVQKELTQQVGEDKDSAEEVKKADYNVIAQQLSEAQRKAEVMQGILAFMNNLIRDAIQTARSIASAG